MGCRETDSGSPRLYRHTSIGGDTAALLLTVEPAAWPPSPDQLMATRRRQMKGQDQRKSPVGGSGGNPVRHREQNATPAMHPGNRQGPPMTSPVLGPRGQDGGLTTDLPKGDTRYRAARPRGGERRSRGRANPGKAANTITKLTAAYYVPEPRGCKPGSRGGSDKQGGCPCVNVSDGGPGDCRAAVRAALGTNVAVNCEPVQAKQRPWGWGSRHAETFPQTMVAARHLRDSPP